MRATMARKKVNEGQNQGMNNWISLILVVVYSGPGSLALLMLLLCLRAKRLNLNP